jgi:hypothetical protein
MAGLTASIASLASLVQRSTVRSLAIAADMSKFAASIALHGLRLTIASKMVRSAALVASRGAVVANEASAISASVASSCWSTSSASGSWCGWIWAVALRPC